MHDAVDLHPSPNDASTGLLGGGMIFMPQTELDALASLEMNGRKVILPIWHNVDLEEVKRLSPSPMLAGRVAVSSHIGIDNEVGQLKK